MHNCPRCGKKTDGSYSLGGVKWAICENCINKEIKDIFDKPKYVESNPKGKSKIYHY